MNSLITKLDQLCYSKFGDNWDDKLFRDRILTNVSATSSVLDVGAGAGIVCQMNFRGIVANVCGVDIDPRIINNRYLDESRVLDAAGITYEDNRFDVAFADNVLEHLENPLSVFREV